MPVFDKNRLVLNFGAPWQTPGIQYLLWPVLGYRLTAPIGRAQIRTNLLEHSLLGLVRAGVSDVGDLAGLLGLGRELVLYICAKLMERDPPALDSRLRLTEVGKRILDDAEIETRVEKTGWIFQDPWTGEVWRRFVTELPTVPITGERNGFPELDLGTEGKPFTTTPMLLEPRSVSVSQPRAEDILRSVRLVDGNRNGDPEDDETSVNRFPESVLGKISYLDSSPEPMYCLTALVTDRDTKSHDAWSIRDPFFPARDSIRLRRALTVRFAEYPFVPKRLAQMLGMDSTQQAASLSELLSRADVAAEMEIKARFGALAETYGLLDRLVELERKRQLMKAMDQHADFDQVPIACGKAAERLMKLLLRSYPAKSLASALELTRGKKCFQLLGQDTSQSLLLMGFTEIPKSLLTIDQGSLRHALLKSEGSLMPLTLATALAALVYEEHPLKHLSKNCPDLLKRIGLISEGRNPGAHDDQRSPNVADAAAFAQHLAEDTLSLVESVLRTMDKLKIKMEAK